MKFKLGSDYFHIAKGRKIGWRVIRRTADTVTIVNIRGTDVFTKRVQKDESGVEFITFSIILKGNVYSDSRVGGFRG